MTDATADAQSESTAESATDNAGSDELTALQAALADLKLTPAQLKSRLADSRKWEDRAKSRSDYDQIKAENEKLRQAGLTESEKAIDSARSEGRQTGEAEAALRYGGKLVQAEAKGLFAGRGLEADRVAVLLEHLPVGSFLTTDGDIDSKALAVYVDAVAPQADTTRTGQAWASPAAFGQGHREPVSVASGAAGQAEAERRWPKAKTT